MFDSSFKVSTDTVTDLTNLTGCGIVVLGLHNTFWVYCEIDNSNVLVST